MRNAECGMRNVECGMVARFRLQLIGKMPGASDSGLEPVATTGNSQAIQRAKGTRSTE
jgi:hypothetical protein